jgi:hypothetical protein
LARLYLVPAELQPRDNVKGFAQAAFRFGAGRITVTDIRLKPGRRMNEVVVVGAKGIAPGDEDATCQSIKQTRSAQFGLDIYAPLRPEAPQMEQNCRELHGIAKPVWKSQQHAIGSWRFRRRCFSLTGKLLAAIRQQPIEPLAPTPATAAGTLLQAAEAQLVDPPRDGIAQPTCSRRFGRRRQAARIPLATITSNSRRRKRRRRRGKAATLTTKNTRRIGRDELAPHEYTS